MDIAVRDAATRTGVEASDATASASEAVFPDSVLGAARSGEWAADMQTSGWTIRVDAGGTSLEYRANPRQVRLVGSGGQNLVVFPV